MKQIACGICGRADRRVVYEATIGARPPSGARLDPYEAHYQINRCLGCGLVYSSPIFDRHEVEALYAESPHGNVVAGEEGNVRRTMRHYYRLARPFLPGRHRILDIGCDVGFLLDIAREDGFQELYGIEPVPTAARVAATVPGAVVSGEFYEQVVYPAGHFDLISLVHVLDHLIDPLEALARALVQLRPGGIIFGVVHNAGSLLARVLGERFPPYNLYHHYFFSRDTLQLLFERAGLEVLRVAPTYNCYSVGFLVEKVPGLPPAVMRATRRILERLGVARRSLTVPLGNIGIVARRPTAGATGRKGVPDAAAA